jgi:dnd system-associated protein 4
MITQQAAVAPRVKRPAEYEELIKRLTSEAEASFGTMREALVFCAALAFGRGDGPLNFDRSAEPIPFQVFESANADKFIDMLALVVSGDHNILADESLAERIEIFEQYAARGLKILDDLLGAAKGRSSADTIRELTLDAYDRSDGPTSDLAQLLSELDS